MPNIATVLKDEIIRITRKELRVQTEGLKKLAMQQRRDIAALKRQVIALEKVATTKKATKARETTDFTASGLESTSPARRFSAARLATQRQKLGLTAAQFGKLIGASGQSVYKWESRGVRPRANQLEAIASVRAMSKSEIEKLLSR